MKIAVVDQLPNLGNGPSTRDVAWCQVKAADPFTLDNAVI
jgi:hypothetical protein